MMMMDHIKRHLEKIILGKYECYDLVWKAEEIFLTNITVTRLQWILRPLYATRISLHHRVVQVECLNDIPTT